MGLVTVACAGTWFNDRSCKWREDTCVFQRVWRVFQSEARRLMAEMNFLLEENNMEEQLKVFCMMK